MSDQYVRTKVLITVMTYPHPSRSYQELVCTAGITENYEWVRLYPIDYRYRPRHQQFRKYQWIEIELLPRGANNDNRKESRKPRLETMRPLGEQLGTKNGWQDRKQIIDRMPVHTIKQQALYDSERVSLGIVRPLKVLDVEIEPADPDWKPEWQALFDQLRLFGPQQKPLRKIPFKFSYVFECEDDKKPHRAMIEDWELGVLWLKQADQLGDERRAAESVRDKYLEELCAPDRDTKLFMGTVFPHNSWVVLGVFWPPKVPGELESVQPTLF